MKLLVIGGSYFYGRVFLMLAAKENEITVVNRGTYSLEEFGVTHKRGERHDGALWQSCTQDYDVIVDFCAYSAGDIACVLDNLGGRVRQYILVSTVDVYQRGTGCVKGEDAPFETRLFPGEAGTYIAGKVTLEQELRSACQGRGIAYTVLRPGILYGPYNYAPREPAFIQIALENHIIPRYVDADGRFQFVYVKDAACAILKCLLNEKTFGQAYNLCQDETLDYDRFFQTLRQAADVETEELPLTLEEAAASGLPVPFPATAQETELVSNEKSRVELEMEYTAFEEGMRKTWRAFKNVYVRHSSR